MMHPKPETGLWDVHTGNWELIFRIKAKQDEVMNKVIKFKATLLSSKLFESQNFEVNFCKTSQFLELEQV